MKIEIKNEIIKKLFRKMKKEGRFKDVREYINHILSAIVEDDAKNERVFSKKEEELIKERLRALGYLN